MARATSASGATPTSMRARDHSIDALPTLRISPLGTKNTVPSMARSRVTRNVMSSTVPVAASPRATTSPTPYWSSMRMKRPDRKSFTRLWAPKPMASPAIPAPANSGARSTPSSPSTMNSAMASTTPRTTLAATSPTVSARCVARVVCGRIGER